MGGVGVAGKSRDLSGGQAQRSWLSDAGVVTVLVGLIWRSGLMLGDLGGGLGSCRRGAPGYCLRARPQIHGVQPLSGFALGCLRRSNSSERLPWNPDSKEIFSCRLGNFGGRNMADA